MNNQRTTNRYRFARLRVGMLMSWLSVSLSMAQLRPAPLRLTLDSLQKRPDIGYPIRGPLWRFHPGHDARWSSSAFDDRAWVICRSWFNPPQFPPGWNGVGWFRLRFTVDASLVGPTLAMRAMHRSASEIYLDGQKIGSFGTMGNTSATNRDVFPHDEPLAFRLARPGEHLLAVRLATRRPPYVSRHIWNAQGVVIQIGLPATLTKLVVSLTRLNDLQLALAFATGLFALLHLILFIGYPGRLSNLYYSGWLLLSTLDFVCAYVDFTAHDPAGQEAATRLDIAVNFALAVTSVAFIYSIYYARQPRRIWLFGAAACLLTVGLLLKPSVEPYTIFFGFLFVCMLEVVRVIFLALRRRQPGVWLIGVGVLVAAFVLYAGPANQLGLWHTGNVDSLFQQALFMTFGYLVLPLCTSVYLAQDVARTNRDLALQVQQVGDLSAKTLAQEAEKRELVARQNQQLEQTVHERTQQLQQQADKLRALDGVKSRFFTNLTHEFRTPLTLMLGPAEQVLAQTKEETTRQQVGLLQRNAQRLLRLINQLLDLSKLEAGKMRLSTAPGDLVRLVRGTLQSFELIANQKGLTLHFTTTHPNLIVYFDRDKLEKMLYNLLANALKFTPAGGTVSVSLTDDDAPAEGWMQLRIEDTGVGIPAIKQPYLFERFYQADASDTREQEGTGIGLALTKELVELHGGTIHLSSQEGAGTLVVVRLPLQAAASVGEAPEQPVLADRLAIAPVDTTPEGEEAPLVLLIEDNAEVRAFIRSSLSGNAGAARYRISEAPNGEIGLQLAQQQVPDVVITDLMMPKMDGYAVCTSLKQDERTSHIPVIMLTARVDLESKLEGLETGADVYLTKPFSQRELQAHLTNLVVLRRQLQQHYSRATLGRPTPGQQQGWPTGFSPLPSMEQVFLDRVRRAIDTHLDDEQYSVERLSEEVCLSRTQLHRKLKALTDQTPSDLLRLLRLQRAHDLLRAHVGTVAEVAYQVGFGNPANFSTSFSRHFGYPPSEVRKKAGLL